MGDLEESCGGTGYVNCFCAGDFCACHMDGGMPCGGCEDCRDFDEIFDGMGAAEREEEKAFLEHFVEVKYGD